MVLGHQLACTGTPARLAPESSSSTSTRQNMSFEMISLRPLASVAPIGVVKLSQRFRLGGDGEESSPGRAGQWHYV